MRKRTLPVASSPFDNDMMEARMPLNQHPVFAPAVMLGLAALFGVAVMLMPGALLEHGVAASGISNWVAGANPPLGDTARALAALAAALAGAVAGLVAARVATRGGNRAWVDDGSEGLFPDSPRRPLHALEELGEDSFDATTEVDHDAGPEDERTETFEPVAPEALDEPEPEPELPVEVMELPPTAQDVADPRAPLADLSLFALVQRLAGALEERRSLLPRRDAGPLDDEWADQGGLLEAAPAADAARATASYFATPAPAAPAPVAANDAALRKALSTLQQVGRGA